MLWQLQVVSIFSYILLPSLGNAEFLSDKGSQPTKQQSLVTRTKLSTYATKSSKVTIEPTIRNVDEAVNINKETKLIMITKTNTSTDNIKFENVSTLTDTRVSVNNTGLRANWWDDLQDIDYDVICKLQANRFDCSTWKNKTFVPRYYYDIKMQACLSFKFYECGLSLNNFLSLFQCNEHCRDPGPQPIVVSSVNIYCRLQPDFGDCHNYHPMYYFDITTRTCKGFAYGGCGGNRNRFDNAQKCVAVCSPVVGAMD